LKAWAQAKEKRLAEQNKDLFFIPTVSTLVEEPLVSESTLVERIIHDLVCLPWGMSLRNWSMWLTLLNSDLMSFINDRAQLIASARNSANRSFVICPLPGIDDCFLMPIVRDQVDESTTFRTECDARSQCHNAAIVLAMIHKEDQKLDEDEEDSSRNNNDFHIRKLLDFLMEFKAKHGIDSLLEEVLAISLSLPGETESVRLLHTLLKNLMKVTSSGEDLQSLLIDFCRTSSSSTLSNKVIAYRRVLVHFSMRYGSEFPKFRELLLSSTGASNSNNGTTQDFWVPRREESVLIAAGKASVNSVIETEQTEVVPENTTAPLNATSADAEVGTDGSTASPSKTASHNFINQLLRRKFDYDENMNPPPASHPILKTLNESLELLASKLYSSDVHFVMELIQNADDNHYQEGVDLSIHFVFDSVSNAAGKKSATLMVMNNEVGFSERNVEAICEIGKSTKKNKSGYIGQKGIG
jgi:hypothetical protein